MNLQFNAIMIMMKDIMRLYLFTHFCTYKMVNQGSFLSSNCSMFNVM